MTISLFMAALALVPQPRKAVERGGLTDRIVVAQKTDLAISSEGYRLTVTANGMTIFSSDAAGAFYASETLKQLETVGAKGYDVVQTPNAICYFDYPQGRLKDDPYQYIGGGGISGPTLERVYEYDPCADVPESARRHVLGAQCNNWSEFTWNECDLAWKMWPRTCALAEVLWTGEARPGCADFKRRMAAHRARLICHGVNCAPLE